MNEVTAEQIASAFAELPKLRALMNDAWVGEAMRIAASAYVGIDEAVKHLDQLPEIDPEGFVEVTAMIASCLLAGYLRERTLRKLNSKDQFSAEETTERVAQLVLSPEPWR